jgi:hypothetical protein
VQARGPSITAGIAEKVLGDARALRAFAHQMQLRSASSFPFAI